MKRTLYIAVLLFINCAVKAQSFAIANNDLHILYVGVNNPLSVAVEGYASNSIILQTNNGIITKTDSNYVFYTSHFSPFSDTIEIMLKQNGELKKIGEQVFKIRGIPMPEAAVGPRSGGSVSKKQLQAQQYIRCGIPYYTYDIHFSVDSFTLTIIKKDICLTKRLFNGSNKFNDDIVNALHSVSKGDVVIFDNIHCKVLGDKVKEGYVWEVAPIAYTITD